ncbi:hypothetical protein D3C75_1010840 [compost metagenome]
MGAAVAHGRCWLTGVRLRPTLDQRTLSMTATLFLVSGSICMDFASTAPPTDGYQRAGGLMAVIDSHTMLACSASGPEP